MELLYRTYGVPILQEQKSDMYRTYGIPILQEQKSDMYRTYGIPILQEQKSETEVIAVKVHFIGAIKHADN